MATGTQLPEPVHLYPTAGNVRLHCVRVPSDERVALLIHGIGMDWRVWQAVSRRLHPLFDLYLVDLRGHGESDKPAHGYGLGHYAADIEDMITALELRDVTVVGSSLGGMVTAAIEAPVDVVGHRILVDPPMTGGPIRDAEMFQEILRLKREPVDRLAAYLAKFNPGFGKHYVNTMSETWHRCADAVIEEMLGAPDDYYAIDSALRGIESPTLVMQGDPELGAVLTDEQARRTVGLLPHGHLVSVPGAGHAIHAQKPVQFTALVQDFMAM
jgi:N-formylmaleamate deformylase